MIQSPFGKLSRNAKYISDSLRWRLFGSDSQSVYFYTIHKCASALFAGYVLPNALGLKHVHYARKIYRGRQASELRFEPTGHVYGPIRVSADRQSPVYDRFVKHVVEPEFIADKKAVFLVRDPRDILVSAYYSFGFNHKLGQGTERKREMLAARSQLRDLTVDQYALANAEFFRSSFDRIAALNQSCEQSVILKYEELIDDFEGFIKKLEPYIQLKPSVIRHLHNVSRPKQKPQHAHRRSGQPSDFRSQLEPETIKAVNLALGKVLADFGFEPAYRSVA